MENQNHKIRNLENQPKKPGSSLKLLILIIVVLAVIAFFLQKGNLSSFTDLFTSHSSTLQKKIISYEILRSWVPGGSGNGMEILVSSDATKEEVLALAKDLVDKYRKQGPLFAMIFDSKEAWANLRNDNYPEEKFYKHKLVSIRVPLDLNFQSQEIVWTAENRNEPKR